MEFEGKVVVITGAGKGIGKIAAEKFAAEGASVAVASRTAAEIERTAEEIRSAGGGKAIAVPTDISEAGVGAGDDRPRDRRSSARSTC